MLARYPTLPSKQYTGFTRARRYPHVRFVSSLMSKLMRKTESLDRVFFVSPLARIFPSNVVGFVLVDLQGDRRK